jgi:hypothetical protein
MVQRFFDANAAFAATPQRTLPQKIRVAMFDAMQVTLQKNADALLDQASLHAVMLRLL